MEDIPEVLLLQILKRLPVCDVIRGRSVSKHWEAVLASPQFARLWRDQPWAVLQRRILSGEQVHVPAQEVWIPGAGATGGAPPFRCGIPLRPPVCESFRILASSNGLVCGRILDADNDHYVLAVGNPLLMGSWKQLPPTPFPDFWLEKDEEGAVLAEMLVDVNSGAYKIALFEYDPRHLGNGINWVDEYDSERGAWREPPAPRYRWEDAEGTELHGTFTAFACVRFSLGLLEEESCNLAAYDMDQCSWSEVTTQFPAYGPGIHSIHDTRVFRHEGRYIMASALLNKKSFLVGFAMWELQEGYAWRCISRLDAREFAGGRTDKRWLVGWDVSKDAVTFKSKAEGSTAVFYVEYDARRKGCWPVVSYNLENSSWLVLQQSLNASYELKCLFQPNLSLRPQ